MGGTPSQGLIWGQAGHLQEGQRLYGLPGLGHRALSHVLHLAFLNGPRQAFPISQCGLQSEAIGASPSAELTLYGDQREDRCWWLVMTLE